MPYPQRAGLLMHSCCNLRTQGSAEHVCSTWPARATTAGTGACTWEDPSYRRSLNHGGSHLCIQYKSHNKMNAVVTLGQKCTIAVGFLHNCLPPEYNSNLRAIPMCSYASGVTYDGNYGDIHKR